MRGVTPDLEPRIHFEPPQLFGHPQGVCRSIGHRTEEGLFFLLLDLSTTLEVSPFYSNQVKVVYVYAVLGCFLHLLREGIA